MARLTDDGHPLYTERDRDLLARLDEDQRRLFDFAMYMQVAEGYDPSREEVAAAVDLFSGAIDRDGYLARVDADFELRRSQGLV